MIAAQEVNLTEHAIGIAFGVAGGDREKFARLANLGLRCLQVALDAEHFPPVQPAEPGRSKPGVAR